MGITKYLHEEMYRGYVIRQITPDIVDVVLLGRHASVDQAKRSIDHFLDRSCDAHRSCERGSE